MAEKLEGIQRRAACLRVLEYKTSNGKLEEWRRVQPESKSMGEGVQVGKAMAATY